MKIARIGCALVLIILVLMVAGAAIAALVPMRFTTTSHGRLEPGRLLRLAFPAQGRVVWLAEPGAVEEGDLVAALDTTAEEEALTALAKQSALLRRQLDLEKRALEAGGRQLEIDIARAERQLEHLETQLEKERGRLAELDLEIVKYQQQEKSLTAELRRSEEAVLASLIGQGLVTQMEMALSKHRADLAKLEAAQLEMQVEREQLTRELRIKELDTQRAVREAEIASLKAAPPGGRTVVELEGRLAEIEAETERLEQTADAKRLRAPFGGRILTASASKGEIVSAGQPVCQLADDSELVFRGTVGQDAIGDVAPGQEALLRMDVYPYLRFGHIKAEIESVETRLAPGETAVYPVAFKLDKAPFRLTPGLTGAADITVYRGTILKYLTRRFREEQAHRAGG